MSYQFNFDAKFYDKFKTQDVKDEEMILDEELKVVNKISHCGRTSCIWDHRVSSGKDDDHPLMNARIFLVATSNDTRKSTPIAPFFPEGMVFPKLDAIPRHTTPVAPDSGPQYTCKRKIIERYIDSYKHANYKVYIWMTMECLTEAFNNKAFPNLCAKNDGFLSTRISEFLIVYAGECRLGQELAVCMWETDEDKLCVQIKKEEEVINYTTIKFF